MFIRGYALHSYERLILKKNKVSFGGLWELDNFYYISIKSGFDIGESDFLELNDWFHESCRVIGTPVEIVRMPPVGAVLVPPRTASELARLHGFPLTSSEMNTELRNALPRNFPRFGIYSDHGGVRVEVERELSEDFKCELDIALANLGFDVEAEVIVKGPVSAQGYNSESVSFHTDNSRLNTPSSPMRVAMEQDQDLWTDSRLELFSEGVTDRHRFLACPLAKEENACFVNSAVVMPGNLRGYLTLYKVVWIALPAADYIASVLSAFKVSESELVELAILGRVGFVLPGNPATYPLGLLAKIVEAAPQSVIFSKRLAAASIAESRRRNPLLFPALNNEQRRSLLDVLGGFPEGPSLDLSSLFVDHFAETWDSLEFNFNKRGAMAMMQNGLSKIAIGMAKKFHGVDLGFQMQMCMASVEWAAALGATYSPAKSSDFNEQPYAEFAGSILTGVRSESIISPVSDMDVLVEGLLCLDNDAPILEVAEVFTGSDVASLQQLMRSNKEKGVDLVDYVNSLNVKVRRFERDQKKVQSRDCIGLLSALVGALPTGGVVTYIPVTIWLLQRMFLQPDSFAQGPIFDWLRAKNSWTSSDVVLLSRLRKNMG